MFDSSGKFVEDFSLHTVDVSTRSNIWDVATNVKDNILLLIALEKPGTEKSWWVQRLTETAYLYHRFRLRKEVGYMGLPVNDTGNILALRAPTSLEEYNNDVKSVRSFWEGIIKNPWDIIVVYDGHVMVVETEDSCVHFQWIRQPPEQVWTGTFTWVWSG